MTSNQRGSWRTRLRFRTAVPLTSADACIILDVQGRSVELRSQNRDQRICDSTWLVANARGFLNEAEAQSFGDRLKQIFLFSSLCRRIGLDLGHNLPTSSPGKVLVDEAQRLGKSLRSNIHGLDVFEDHGNTHFLLATGEGTFRAGADQLISLIEAAAIELPESLPGSMDAIALLNGALMNREPLGRLVLAISAVEMLGQTQIWTAAQEAYLDKLADEAESHEILAPNERQEISEAIRRGIHRVGLRQGVVRILNSLDLGHLKSKWDSLYSQRSAIFHGIKQDSQRGPLKREVEYSVLAEDAISLCSEIVLALAQKDGVSARLIREGIA